MTEKKWLLDIIYYFVAKKKEIAHTYIVIHKQTVSLYHNSFVWPDT